MLFSNVTSYSDIPELTVAYQEQRAARCADVQHRSRLNQRKFHLLDGEEQQARDIMYANINPLAVENDNKSTFDYDAAEIARKWMQERGIGKM